MKRWETGVHAHEKPRAKAKQTGKIILKHRVSPTPEDLSRLKVELLDVGRLAGDDGDERLSPLPLQAIRQVNRQPVSWDAFALRSLQARRNGGGGGECG